MNLQLLLTLPQIIGIVVAVVVVIAIIAIVCWGIAVYNSFIQLGETCEEAVSTIDVSLKKRFDLIPNLVETVKGFAKHESQTLEKVIAARNQGLNATTVGEKIAADKNLSQAIKSINIVAEQYPNLKADQNFLDLQNQLKLIEGELANARRYYNGTVKAYNTKRKMFPTNVIANMMKLAKYDYFEVDSAEERQNVKVSF
ncbi:MAG: LemA family protein [Clostridiales bacterium]|nr:LemA family protein [Clostridiales bacterium]